MNNSNEKSPTDKTSISEDPTLKLNSDDIHTSESDQQWCFPERSNVKAMVTPNQSSTYNYIMPFYQRHMLFNNPLWAQGGEVARHMFFNNTPAQVPRISQADDREYVVPEQFTSFLRSENSFLCPWSWERTRSTTSKQMYFEPGSFFEFQGAHSSGEN